MKELTDWREAVVLPVIASKPSRWSFIEFEKILTENIASCAWECLRINKGVICTTLSGGLDSSFCLAKLREAVGKDLAIHTFTTGGSDKYPDVLFARKVARQFKTFHHELIPSEEQIKQAEKYMRFLWKDEPRRQGNLAVFLTYQNIARIGLKSVIAHDGIDELLGGYWDHRKHTDEQKMAAAFHDFWDRLEKEHLLLLERKAHHFGVRVILPYLQREVVEYISKIPLKSRTGIRESKLPLRVIAKKHLPKEVIKRMKKGFCSALDKE